MFQILYFKLYKFLYCKIFQFLYYKSFHILYCKMNVNCSSFYIVKYYSFYIDNCFRFYIKKYSNFNIVNYFSSDIEKLFQILYCKMNVNCSSFIMIIPHCKNLDKNFNFCLNFCDEELLLCTEFFQTGVFILGVIVTFQLLYTLYLLVFFRHLS